MKVTQTGGVYVLEPYTNDENEELKSFLASRDEKSINNQAALEAKQLPSYRHSRPKGGKV